MRRAVAACALALACLAGAWVPRARASIEEFASFDLSRMEEDDESALDHYLARQPAAWRDEWEGTTNAFRTSQGCLTAGLWNTEYETKLRSPLGEHSHLDLELLQVMTDYAQYDWLSLDFHFRTPAGLMGVRFRPNYDKSQQDFALLWNHGDGTSPLQIEAALTVEDMFNTLWEFRQARVNDHNEPYRRHPFEPSARVVSRGKKHRLEVSGAWLTPSRKAIDDPNDDLDGSFTLWGSRFLVLDEHQFSGWTIESRLDGERALSMRTVRSAPGNARVFRRLWNGELALRHALGPATQGELRWIYKDRAQSWAPPAGDGRLRARDRVLAGEVSHRFSGRWLVRSGLMYDRVSIAVHGGYPGFTWGSRKESRAYVGLRAKFGRVSVQGIECIELDHEPYEVSFHHDKGFLQLQTTF
ncbi:MAG: hypothetical protein HZA61_16695 [Candidatus Eisenbacteria bacterium]|uniref:Uncharacterized protein n=1 Tax=Eiseniibacteriota bacterium TaxID=2212470 RepID=A0A933SFE2_UNCEI|nr:hypothetical protein [Candidatus Eisenbacteria bacterium]